MNSEELIDGIKSLFIDEPAESYQELYIETETSNDTDQYSRDIKSVMSSLDEDGKQALFNLIRMICIDNTTSFCSFLDGSCGYVGQDSDLCLTSGNNPDQKLNGDLMMLLDRCLGNQ
jgi:hypothetical protein